MIGVCRKKSDYQQDIQHIPGNGEPMEVFNEMNDKVTRPSDLLESHKIKYQIEF